MGIAAFSCPIPCDECRTPYPYPRLPGDLFGSTVYRDILEQQMLAFPQTSAFARYRKLARVTEGLGADEIALGFAYRCENCIGDDKTGWSYRKEGFIMQHS
jgi:hypothetical protein